MGKTALALSIARGACINGAGVHIASMEMSRKKLWHRMLSDVARDATTLPYQSLGRRGFYGDQRDALTAARDVVAAMPLYVDDQSGRSPEQVAAAARRSKRLLEARGFPLGLIVVDYLQLMPLDRAYASNPAVAIGLQTKVMKALAEHLDCTVMLLSQLSRAVENRDDKRPQLSDLRQSGEIEQDADIVGLLLRPEYYLERSETASDEDRADVRGVLKLFIDKNRHGETGVVNLDCDIACNAVRDAGALYPTMQSYRAA
jgi:replicative DNA helicase